MNAPLSITPADTTRAKLAQPGSSFTRDECAAIIDGRSVNYGALGHCSADDLPTALHATVGHPKARKPIADVLWTDLETPAAYFARKARERAVRVADEARRAQPLDAFMRDINREADRLFRSVKGRAR